MVLRKDPSVVFTPSVGYVSQIALYVAGGLLLVFATFDLPSIS